MTWGGSKWACSGEKHLRVRQCSSTQTRGPFIEPSPRFPATYIEWSTALRSAVEQSESLRHRCLRHVEMLMVQTSQVAACNARHNLPERLARWLLMVRDRTDSDSLPMTQEFLSVMLGVRRSGVSVAASTLQAAGLVRVLRGHVLILITMVWQRLHATAIASSSRIAIRFSGTEARTVRRQVRGYDAGIGY